MTKKRWFAVWPEGRRTRILKRQYAIFASKNGNQGLNYCSFFKNYNSLIKSSDEIYVTSHTEQAGTSMEIDQPIPVSASGKV